MKHQGVKLLFAYLLIVCLLGLPVASSAASMPEENSVSQSPGLVSPRNLEVPDSTSWGTEPVDELKQIYVNDSSLALDSSGLPHIAYSPRQYARYDGAAWQIETLPYAGLFVLDAADHRHFLYNSTEDDITTVNYATYDGSTWHTEAVVAGSGQDFALDSVGRPHFVYTVDGEIHYAWYDGSTWQFGLVDSGGGMHISLALDTADLPNISYFRSPDGSTQILKYAHFDGAAWQIEDVVNIPYYNVDLSLAVDGADLPHIAFSFCEYGCSLYYTHFDGAVWQQSEVGLGVDPSLALDAAGAPHISYVDVQDYTRAYAHHDGATWQHDSLESLGYSPYPSAIALTSAGAPRITYVANGDLKYAWHDGTTWQLETVDIGGSLKAGSLVAGAGGTLHASYYESTKGSLKYAYYDGATWQTEVVDSAGDVGEFSSLALDADGRPHIAYTDWTNSVLKYAYYDGGSWQFDTVGSAANGQPSLAIDADGHPHISYVLSPSGFGVLYAYHDGAAWQIETISTEGYVTGTSLALDAAEQPNVAYNMQFMTYALVYARFDGSDWLVNVVDQAGNVGLSPSLVLDGEGHRHISYYDMDQRLPKYATYDGSQWSVEALDSSGSLGPDALDLNSAGLPRIVYTGSGELRYASYDGSTWQIETVASVSTSQPALALDAGDLGHISFSNGGDLYHAYQVVDCPTPLTEVSVIGPEAGFTGVSHDFSGSVTPADATEPITYLWSPEPDSGQGTVSASYIFDLPGSYSVSLSAENCGGAASDTAYAVIISEGAVAVVDPETGATLEYIDAQGNPTSVEVPPDAVTEPIVLTLEPVDTASPPSGLAFADHAFELTAYLDGQPLTGFTFEIPIQVTISYSDVDVAGLDESALDLQYWTGSEWSTDGITIVNRDTANNQMEVTIAHLSTFAMFGEYQYRVYMPLVLRNY